MGIKVYREKITLKFNLILKCKYSIPPFTKFTSPGLFLSTNRAEISQSIGWKARIIADPYE
jgi:hypothetical protein